MKDTPAKEIVLSFLTWRAGLFLVAFLATFLLRFNNSFPYINSELVTTHLPNFVWSFGNFDGVHYLRLAKTGYSSEYTQAFFPVYPLLIGLFSFGNLYFLAGLLLSNLSFLAALYFLYKLFKIDYSEKISRRSLILLIAFPTAFYFGAIYSESVFLLTAVLSLYFARRKKFLISAIFVSLASATRVIGIFLWFSLAVEIYLAWRKREVKPVTGLISLIIAPMGLLAYSLFLLLNFNNPLYYLTAQSAFGASRSSSLVLLPQVLVRYLKIFLTVPARSYPFFNAAAEFIFTVIPLGGVLIFFRRIRLSYLLFTLGCLVLPTLTGTLSSMPRYALMVFPALPLLAALNDRSFKIILVSFIMIQIVLLSLFSRGYWIA